MEGPGLGRRGREADLLIPLVFVKAVRGGENLPVWGFPVHQKGSMALGAPCCGAHPIRRQVQCRPRSAPCKRALHLSAVMAHLYGPSIRGTCAGYRGATSAATALPQEGLCRVESRTSSIAWVSGKGHGTRWGRGDGGVFRLRRTYRLVPRACARAVGMGWGVESSVGRVGFPLCCGSSLSLG